MITTTKTTKRNTSTLLGAVAAIALLPGLLAGCSSAGPSGDSTKGAGSSGSSVAECMRGKGYDMEDQSTSDKAQTLSVPDGVDRDQWTADLGSCLGDGGADGGDGAGVSGAKPVSGGDAKDREVAKCIRDKGFDDYPDDVDARASYEPSDEQAFADVAKQCDDDVFGPGESVQQ